MHNTHIEKMARMLEEEGLLCPDMDGIETLPRVVEALQRHWEDRIAIVWSVQDVLECAPAYDKNKDVIEGKYTLNTDEARDILKNVGRKHDASKGVSWQTIETAISQHKEDLF